MYRRKRVDPRVIGSFVVGAIILGVAGLAFFGPGGLISETRSYVLHFNSSVKGLNVGSPVRFRGVKIGQVRDINVRVRTSDFQFHIPVVIEIEPTRIEAEGSSKGFIDAIKTSFKGDPLEPLIDKGFRGQLVLDSLVTGQLYVNFDMYPNTPITLAKYETDYPELPTIPSSLGELTKTFEDIPLRDLANKLISSANGFERLVNSPSLHNGLKNFDTMSEQMTVLLSNMNEQVPPLMNSLQETVLAANKMINHVDQKIDPLANDFRQARIAFNSALEKFDAAAMETETTMKEFQGIASADSRLQQQLSATLQEINKAARSVRYLTTEIERDPQILLRGRGEGENH